MPGQTEDKNDHIVSYDINLPYAGLTAETAQTTDYPEYMPVWEKVFFDPLPPFPFHDPALRVTDPSLPNLLTPGVSLKHIQPSLGTVVHGLQLSTLSDVQKDELAHLVSHRKILAFPEQDLVDAGPAAQQAFMDHFGKRNYQPISGSVKGFPGFHIIHRDGNREEIRTFLGAKTTTTLWHQDVSYEIQPPGYVMLGLLQGPEVGGDTVFAATDTAYKRLSPAVQGFLDKLDVVHTSARMISHARAAGGLVRKDPVETVHPLVRVHPVTGERCLFLNAEFVTGIVGLKDAEREMLVDFLMRHMVSGHDFQARVSWSPRTIVIFDNRSCLHSAIVDYIDEEFNAQPRHIFRLCAMAEKPIPVERDEKINI